MSDAVNVDPAELAKFSELAHRWWDQESEFRPLHQINPLRLAWIQEQVLLDGLQVLDVGCGGGILADAMARQGAQVLGIDLAEKSLRVAQLHALEAQTPHIQYREISAEALAEEMPQAFDVVTCTENARARSRPWLCSTRMRRTGETWWMGVFFNHQPQSQVFCSRNRGSRICAQNATQRNP